MDIQILAARCEVVIACPCVCPRPDYDAIAVGSGVQGILYSQKRRLGRTAPDLVDAGRIHIKNGCRTVGAEHARDYDQKRNNDSFHQPAPALPKLRYYNTFVDEITSVFRPVAGAISKIAAEAPRHALRMGACGECMIYRT